MDMGYLTFDTILVPAVHRKVDRHWRVCTVIGGSCHKIVVLSRQRFIVTNTTKLKNRSFDSSRNYCTSVDSGRNEKQSFNPLCPGAELRPLHHALCYCLFLQKQTQDISLLRIFQLCHIVLHSYQSVQCVCVCVCIFRIVMVTFSISMYIMCVCLFSALSCWVGTLQISIIIIIMVPSDIAQSCMPV